MLSKLSRAGKGGETTLSAAWLAGASLLWNHKLDPCGAPVKCWSCSQTGKFLWIFLEFTVFMLNSANSVNLQSCSRAARQNCKSLVCTHASACGTMLQITTGRNTDRPTQTNTYWYILTTLGPIIKLVQLLLLKHSTRNSLWKCCSLLYPDQMTWFAVRCRLVQYMNV